MAGIAAAVRRFDALPLGGEIADAELPVLLEQLHRAEQMVAAQKLRVVREIEQRHAHAAAGAATTEDLLAQRCGLTKSEAKTQTQAAAALALPAVADKLRAGQMTVGQAQVVAGKATAIQQAAPDLQTAEQALQRLDTIVAGTDTAKTDRGRLGRTLDRWAHAGGHDVLAQRERRAHAERYLQIVERDGGFDVRGRLDTVGGAAFKAAVDALARPHTADDPRTWGQRQADAVVALTARYLDEGRLPEVAAQRPHVILVTTPEALHDLDGAEPSLLDGVGPVSTDTARQLCCDAEVTLVTRSRNGDPLHLGRATRTPTRAQRSAVIARDRECIGCGAPITMCQVHHVKWWRHGGTTDIGNLVLVCWSCHHHIHHEGWQITRDASGRYRTGPPGQPDSRLPSMSMTG